jgi:hypothetical protein
MKGLRQNVKQCSEITVSTSRTIQRICHVAQRRHLCSQKKEGGDAGNNHHPRPFLLDPSETLIGCKTQDIFTNGKKTINLHLTTLFPFPL